MKYELLRRKLMKSFEYHKCPRVEELADETIDRVAVQLLTTGVRDMNRYAYGVARLVRLEAHRIAAKNISIHQHPQGEGLMAVDEDPEERIIEEMTMARRLECLQGCLEKLPAERRRLMLDYYTGDKQIRITQRQEMARTRGVSMGALRSEANRIRQKLKSCVDKCVRKRAETARRAGDA